VDLYNSIFSKFILNKVQKIQNFVNISYTNNYKIIVFKSLDPIKVILILYEMDLSKKFNFRVFYNASGNSKK
jgi:hypothetical protein